MLGYFLIAIIFLWMMFSYISTTVWRNTETHIDWKYEALTSDLGPSPESEIRRRISSYIKTSDPFAEIYILQDRNGKTVETNYPYQAILDDDWIVLDDFDEDSCERLMALQNEVRLPLQCQDSIHEEHDEGPNLGWFSISSISEILPLPNETEGYVGRVGKIGDYKLLVGRSLDLVDETRDAASFLTLIIIPISLLMALLVGLFVSRNVRARLKVINDRCNEIETSGNLSLRVPDTGPDDEYSILTSHVNGMLGRLDKAVQNIQAVSDDLAHDLRTPLARLKYNFETALSKKSSTKVDLQTALQKGLDETDSLLETFSAILRVSQIQTGKRKTKFQDFNLSDTIDLISEIYEPQAQENGHDLQCHTSADDMALFGDQEMITQMLSNLVENSFEHGGQNLKIKLSAKQLDGQIIIALADNGNGVSQEDLPNIFDKFYRGDKSRQNPGNGLGLSIVKAVADLHDAKITARENDPGLFVEIIFQSTSQRP